MCQEGGEDSGVVRDVGLAGGDNVPHVVPQDAPRGRVEGLREVLAAFHWDLLVAASEDVEGGHLEVASDRGRVVWPVARAQDGELDSPKSVPVGEGRADQSSPLAEREDPVKGPRGLDSIVEVPARDLPPSPRLTRLPRWPPK